jgi:hypothetical protein
MNPPAKGPLVLPSTTKRDALIAAIAGIIVLAFVGYGIVHMASPVQGNKLSGTIVEKIFIPQKEERINFSGRRIEGTKEIAGEFILKVRVDPDGRIYEVPVEEPQYHSKKVGDTLIFLRPPSEQR